MAHYRAEDLDQFVADCDRLGGVGDPRAKSLLAEFHLHFETRVDQSLDPFSEAYFQGQSALYTELSGRPLDQESGERTPLDVDAHAAADNPYNSRDVQFLSKHNRAVLTCLTIANLSPGATVLDAGSGWGLSSEAMARCGASVTALDINPLFVELVRRRAERLGLPIESVRAGFDDYEADRDYDLLLFYECLHHSVRPWVTLARLGRFVKPGGKVMFAGEPINGYWWKHWGMRLDPVSVYCVRKFGWWESGWTEAFITECFARAGLTLRLHHDIGLDNGIVGTASRTSEAQFDFTVAEVASRSAAQLADCRVELAEARNALACVRASRSWRLTAPMRSVFKVLGAGRG